MGIRMMPRVSFFSVLDLDTKNDSLCTRFMDSSQQSYEHVSTLETFFYGTNGGYISATLPKSDTGLLSRKVDKFA